MKSELHFIWKSDLATQTSNSWPEREAVTILIWHSPTSISFKVFTLQRKTIHGERKKKRQKTAYEINHCGILRKAITMKNLMINKNYSKNFLIITYDSAIPLLGIYPERNIIWKDAGTRMFIAALFTIARKHPLTDEWIRKTWYLYTVEYYSAGEEFAWNAGNPVSIPGSEDSLEKGTATHSSILVWRVP